MSRSANRSTAPGRKREWAVRVYYKPFVNWIWGGCVLMALGGLLAMLDRRYRVKSRASSASSTPRRGTPTTHEPLFSGSLVGFAALVALLAVGLGLNPRDVPSPLVGKPAPTFTLPVLATPEQDARPEGHAGQGLAAQRLGLVVRLLPRRSIRCWSNFSKNGNVPLVGLNYKEVRGDGGFDMSKMAPRKKRSWPSSAPTPG